MNEWTLQTPYLGYVLAIVAALTVAAFAKNGKRSIVSTALLPPAVVGLIVLLVWLAEFRGHRNLVVETGVILAQELGE